MRWFLRWLLSPPVWRWHWQLLGSVLSAPPSPRLVTASPDVLTTAWLWLRSVAWAGEGWSRGGMAGLHQLAPCTGKYFCDFFSYCFWQKVCFFLYKSWSVGGWLDLTCKVNDNLVSIWMSKYSLYIVKLSKKQWWKNVIWLGKKEEALKKNIHPWVAHQGSGRPRPDIDNRYWTSWIKGIY